MSLSPWCNGNHWGTFSWKEQIHKKNIFSSVLPQLPATMRCEEMAAKGRKKLFKALLNEKEERENLDLSACFFLLHLSHTSLCPLNPVPKEPRALTHCSDQGTFTPISVKGEGRIQLSFLSRYFFYFMRQLVVSIAKMFLIGKNLTRVGKDGKNPRGASHLKRATGYRGWWDPRSRIQSVRDRMAWKSTLELRAPPGGKRRGRILKWQREHWSDCVYLELSRQN